jgi:hypothetical protein
MEDEVAAIMAGALEQVLSGAQGYLPGPEARITFRRRAGTRTRTGRIDMAYYYYTRDANGNYRHIVPFCAEYNKSGRAAALMDGREGPVEEIY